MNEGNGRTIVHVERDYKQFKFMPGNRQIDYRQVSRLKNSIQENNLTMARPIIVNEKMQVIDGQHTYLACKELGYPIHYIIHQGGSIADVQSLNSSTTNWTGYDYLHMYRERGLKNYQILHEFIERWRFNLWDSMRLLMNRCGGGSITGAQFRSGNFVVADIEKANKYAQMIYDFAPYTDHFRGRSFVMACLAIFGLRGYKHSQMMAQLKARGKQIPRKQGHREYLLELDKIYNQGQPVKYSLYLQSRD